MRPIPNSNQHRDLNFTTRFIIVVLVFLFTHSVHAAPNQLGQTGLINMPDARIDEEGTLRFGLSYMQPYSALWDSVSLFRWHEMSVRYTEIDDV